MSSEVHYLPGRDRSICYVPQEGPPVYISNLLPCALNLYDFERAALPMITLREITMLQLMNTITDKPQRHIKINDPVTAARWREEVLTSGADITARMVDWCLDELRYKSSPIQEDAGVNLPPIVVYNGDVVNRTALCLRNSNENYRKQSPRSDGKVSDLVQPSLYSLVYGRTRVLPPGTTTTLADCIQRCGGGNISRNPTENAIDLEVATQECERDSYHETEMLLPYSTKFQWLPCEVDISGDDPRITSYINNLHPLRERSLYSLIGQIVKASIPLWNLTLAPGHTDSGHRVRIHYNFVDHASKGEINSGLIGPIMNQTDTEEIDDDDEWGRPVIRPQPERPFRPFKLPEQFSIEKEFSKQGLQVIVKLANIELTPENPEYSGGTFRLEGQMNEHIVATSLYYYSCSNITPSTLNFRQSFHPLATESVGAEHSDFSWLREVFGLRDYRTAVQDVGCVDTREGRLLTFPNVLLHRVGAFKLADSSKPGHRKIVALFLRQDWRWQTITNGDSNEETPPLAMGTSSSNTSASVNLLDQIPAELHDEVLKDVDFPISLENAKSIRMELMEERKEYATEFFYKQGEALYISLCEH